MVTMKKVAILVDGWNEKIIPIVFVILKTIIRTNSMCMRETMIFVVGGARVWSILALAL